MKELKKVLYLNKIEIRNTFFIKNHSSEFKIFIYT